MEALYLIIGLAIVSAGLTILLAIARLLWSVGTYFLHKRDNTKNLEDVRGI